MAQEGNGSGEMDFSPQSSERGDHKASRSRKSIVVRPGAGAEGASSSGEEARRPSKAGKSAQDEEKRQRFRHREGGLPAWLWRNVSDLQTVGPDDPSLRSVCGLQGLLLEALAQKPTDDHVISITLPSLEKAARAEQEYRDSGHVNASNGLIASEGKFRFVELRFSSVQSAQKCAFLLYCCTFSARHRVAVPLLSRPVLQSADICKQMLKLWDIYGLVWPQGDRTSLYQIRQRFARMVDVVGTNGRDTWRNGVFGLNGFAEGGVDTAAESVSVCPRRSRRSAANTGPSVLNTLVPRSSVLHEGEESSPSRKSASAAAGSALIAVRGSLQAQSAAPRRSKRSVDASVDESPSGDVSSLLFD